MTSRRRASLTLLLIVPWSLLLCPIVWHLVQWDQVTADRNGAPERSLPVHYEIRVLNIDPVILAPSADGLLEWSYALTFREDQVTETEWTIPDPHPGAAVVWWDPVAVDAAGNRSDAP